MIEVEDVLLGVLITKPSAIADFASPGSDVSSLAKGDTPEAMLARLISNRALGAVEIPFSSLTKRAFERAGQEADALGHTVIRPEHLVLGILRDETTPAWKTLHEAGVSLREMRRRLAGP